MNECSSGSSNSSSSKVAAAATESSSTINNWGLVDTQKPSSLMMLNYLTPLSPICNSGIHSWWTVIDN